MPLAPARASNSEIHLSTRGLRLTITPWGRLLQACLFRGVLLSNPDDCLAGIHAALEAGADANARDSEGWSPLERAAAQCPGGAVVTVALQALLAAGADVRAKDDIGHQPLYAAASNSNAEATAGAVAAGRGGSRCAGTGQQWPRVAARGSWKPECRGSSSSDRKAGRSGVGCAS